MDYLTLIKTLVLCLMSIVIEIFSVTKNGKEWFENLKQPKFSFSFKVWYFIGGLYYIICGTIAYRQFQNSQEIFSGPVILLVLIMITNGLTNFILFKYRSLKWFYLVLYPFTGLFLSLVLFLVGCDNFSMTLSAAYLIWLVYDVFYFKNLWKLNPA